MNPTIQIVSLQFFIFWLIFNFSTAKEDRDYTAPDMGSTIDDGTSSSIFNLLRGKKFLAAVVTGSSIGEFSFFVELVIVFNFRYLLLIN